MRTVNFTVPETEQNRYHPLEGGTSLIQFSVGVFELVTLSPEDVLCCDWAIYGPRSAHAPEFFDCARSAGQIERCFKAKPACWSSTPFCRGMPTDSITGYSVVNMARPDVTL